MTRTSTNVVEAVARSKDIPIESLPSLYDAVDPDALDSLFSSASGFNGDRRAGTIRFSFAGCEVTVRPPDEVVVDGDPPHG